MNSTTTLLAAFAIAAATTAACSSDDPEATTTTATNPSGTGGNGQGGATTSAGGATTTTTGNGAGGEGPMCDAPRPAHPGNSFEPGTVTASFTDQDGGAAGEMIVDLCGTNICLVFGETDASGDVTLPGNGSADDPALLYGDGKEYAKLAGQILEAELPKAYGAVNALRYPTALGSGSLLAEGANEDNGVTLTIPSGSVIDVDGLIYDNPSDATFRVAVESLDGSLNLPGVDPALNLEVILAMAPIDTVICPGASLTFPNTENWTDGAEVEIFIHGTKIGSHYAPYTQWAKVAEATVQGNDVVLKDGEVIELIGTYGARLKP